MTEVPVDGSELVLFEFNRIARQHPFLSKDDEATVAALFRDAACARNSSRVSTATRSSHSWRSRWEAWIGKE